MLEIIKDDEDLSNAFSAIWDSCSDMERYVQYGFSVEERHLIFGKENWNNLKCNSLKEVGENLLKSEDLTKKELSIKEIATSNFAFELNNDHAKSAPDRFNSVVNFQNFLLYFKNSVQIRTLHQKDEEKSVSLDDKRLLIFLNPS